jgi:hypothetical protein
MARRPERVLLTLGIAGFLPLTLAGSALTGCGASNGITTNIESNEPLDANPVDVLLLDTGNDLGRDAPADGPGPDTGSRTDSGADATGEGQVDFSNCGRVTSIFDDIGETTVGLSLTVQGTASGPDPSSLTFAWSANPQGSGTFSPPAGSGVAPSATFTCLQPGMVTVTLTVSDGLVPDAAPNCHDVDHMSLVVVCDPSPDGG